jgi:hydrogenase nickel incorporation protein HypA/HybF
MHELGVALSVVDACSARAEGARVARVVVEIGRLCAVLPDALTLSFQVATAGTSLEGARLEIRELRARGRCRECGVESDQSGYLAECACGAMAFEWLSGHELQIKEMELA